ncbi:hypothetical protein TNCT_197551, partial [Trichonephila clavata]
KKITTVITFNHIIDITREKTSSFIQRRILIFRYQSQSVKSTEVNAK